MGVIFKEMHSYFEDLNSGEHPEYPRQVLSLAEKSLSPILEAGLPNNLSHLIVATTCPDMLAPSLGQMITEKFHSEFSNCHTIDMVQGCAGGVSAMILGSQLAAYNNSSVLIVQADAAKKATSTTSKINKIFGNGSFACLISHEQSTKGMLHNKSL
jgi:3-oxoacyl-[acyl-carrier-protein] synthase III